MFFTQLLLAWLCHERHNIAIRFIVCRTFFLLKWVGASAPTSDEMEIIFTCEYTECMKGECDEP